MSAQLPPGAKVLIFGPLLAIPFLVAFIGIESVVLWRSGWGSFRRSLSDAAIGNGLSIIAGSVLYFLLVRQYSGVIECERARHTPSGVDLLYSCIWPRSRLVDIILLFVTFVVLEAVVLTVRRRGRAGQAWRASLLANAVSYILVLPVIWLILFTF